MARQEPGRRFLAGRLAELKIKSARLSIFPVLDDYRVNQSSRQACDACRHQEKTRDEIHFLGDIEPGKFPEMLEEQQQAMPDECFEYDDHLRASGYLAAGEGPPETALILYWKNGKVATTDGPYGETKEQLGSIPVLEARDLNHAIQLFSPSTRRGSMGRGRYQTADLSDMVQQTGANALQTKRRCAGQEQFKRQDKPAKREEHI